MTHYPSATSLDNSIPSNDFPVPPHPRNRAAAQMVQCAALVPQPADPPQVQPPAVIRSPPSPRVREVSASSHSSSQQISSDGLSSSRDALSARSRYSAPSASA